MYHNFFIPSILLLSLPNYNSINFFYFSWVYHNYKPQEYYILTMRSLCLVSTKSLSYRCVEMEIILFPVCAVNSQNHPKPTTHETLISFNILSKTISQCKSVGRAKPEGVTVAVPSFPYLFPRSCEKLDKSKNRHVLSSRKLSILTEYTHRRTRI